MKQPAQTTAIADLLAEALRNLLDRVMRNGGLGEYQGGRPFAIKQAREALEVYQRYIPKKKPTRKG